MRIELRENSFEPWREIAAFHAALGERRSGVGAIDAFVGTMRDFNEGDPVSAMTLEHYPEMTARELARIADEAATRWPLIDGLIIHRVGRIAPGEAIVAVAIASAHRAAAFDACRGIMEALKSRAPFWKRETTPAGDRWVEHNTPG